MKKTLFALLALATVSTAAADSLGLRTNYNRVFVENASGNFTFGVEYAYDIDSESVVRAGIDLDPDVFGSGVFGLGGDVAYLRNFDGVGDANYNVYYGASLGLEVATASSEGARITIFGLTPAGVVGTRYFLTPEFGLSAEVNVGPTFAFGLASVGSESASVSNSAFGAGVRFGINYRF
ncbi:hypothetical protein [Deinococcus puniceus]|uniref:Outer membrane protein beta-barrel domain-containing protein n=1 Tax=Deinococcus puniceus TaxID=1182568 RepID=A0A172T705_9DEIO|nr:hypothetical protein [Deinococcus puniceus]ANE42716.1 hypothetical protein SU48_01900 [Deinococcus puniceus]